MEEGVLGFYAANAALSGLINKDDGGYEDDDDGMYLFRHNVAPSKIEKEDDRGESSECGDDGYYAVSFGAALRWLINDNGCGFVYCGDVDEFSIFAAKAAHPEIGKIDGLRCRCCIIRIDKWGWMGNGWWWFIIVAAKAAHLKIEKGDGRGRGNGFWMI